MPRFDKLLVLDLDETLIHAREEPLARDPDFMVGPYYVYKRPGVGTFLQQCLDWFDVAVWTSATASYADEVITGLLENPGLLKFVWSRKQCTPVFDPESQLHSYVKDIRKITKKGWKKEGIIIVEDLEESVRRNYGNAVIVERYLCGPDDTVLEDLIGYLETLGAVENVRSVEKRGWRESLRAASNTNTTRK